MNKLKIMLSLVTLLGTSQLFCAKFSANDLYQAAATDKNDDLARGIISSVKDATERQDLIDDYEMISFSKKFVALGGGSFGWKETYADKTTEAADKLKNLFVSGNQDDVGFKAIDAVLRTTTGKNKGDKEANSAAAALTAAKKAIEDAEKQLPK